MNDLFPSEFTIAAWVIGIGLVLLILLSCAGVLS
jgi:hypothetical protein